MSWLSLEKIRTAGVKGEEEQLFADYLKQLSQTNLGPLDWTGALGKREMASANSFAKPSEELVSRSFYEYRLTTDAEQRNDRVMARQLAMEPICPLRDAGKSVHMGKRGPHKARVGMSQQSSTATRRSRRKLLRDADHMAHGSLSVPQLNRASIALGIPSEKRANRSQARRFDRECFFHMDGSGDRTNLRFAADHRQEVGFGLAWRIWGDFANEAVEMKLEMSGCLVRSSVIGERAEAKMGVQHGGLCFSCVRI